MTRYEELIQRKSREYGDKFCTDELNPQFVQYFNSGERVKVATQYGEFKHGTIGITTGWRPCFLLMKARNHIGSSDTLGSYDVIVAVQRNGKYIWIA